MRREVYKGIKDIPRQEYLAGGTGLCGGCGGLLALRLLHKALGPNVVFVNAAGCLTLLAVFPFTPFHSSWLYTAMASAPAGAQGIRDALDMLIAKGRLSAADDLKVVVVTGDGAANGIGLQATLAAIHRRLEFYYFCYDNEAFANTGFQFSPASPFGSQTGTTPVTPSTPGGTALHKQDLFKLWHAQAPAFLATVSPAYPLDLMDKVARAGRATGPKMFISLAACPPGWGVEPSDTVEVAKLAVETGVWPLKEVQDGHVVHTVIPTHFRPVEDYLQGQARYRHLFEPVRQEDILSQLQHDVDRYWAEAEAAPAGASPRAAAQA
ncbi:MAG: Pyruvate:ferredoxin oxidoreductase, beta subunit [Deltaproteobacteria bacterium]|jgi:pyruvate ferredoxin oxidoreductase beta subunit|nr:Pyruvate:ferredoxin oxidoreductase, beta subunit [Deltaproteobacteria bacterium]